MPPLMSRDGDNTSKDSGMGRAGQVSSATRARELGLGGAAAMLSMVVVSARREHLQYSSSGVVVGLTCLIHGIRIAYLVLGDGNDLPGGRSEEWSLPLVTMGGCALNEMLLKAALTLCSIGGLGGRHGGLDDGRLGDDEGGRCRTVLLLVTRRILALLSSVLEPSEACCVAGELVHLVATLGDGLSVGNDGGGACHRSVSGRRRLGISLSVLPEVGDANPSIPSVHRDLERETKVEAEDEGLGAADAPR